METIQKSLRKQNRRYAKLLLYVVGTLMLLVAAPLEVKAQGLAPNCLAIKAANPGAGDGHYIIAPAGKVFVVYCHDMAGVPREYLTLANTGGSFNYSFWGGETSNPQGGTVSTEYAKIRLDPFTLLVEIGDQTFASSVGSDCCIGITPINSMPYSVAADCHHPFSNLGNANVDLTGLPFIVDDTFVVRGFAASGCVNGDCGGDFHQVPVATAVVNLTGGGFCGGTHPGPITNFAPINNEGGFALQLKYTGDVTLGPDLCKHGGWRDFGVFKNQGDCVSFFTTGGKNEPFLPR